MSTEHRPSSLDGIKRFAKKINREDGLQHARALDEAARLAGYQNYTHARSALEKGAPPAQMPSKPENPRAAFRRRARAAWTVAVDAVNPERRNSCTWEGMSSIRRVLQAFMGENANHAHLPSGGGRDFLSADLSAESDCIDFAVGEQSSYIAKPRRLVLERIAEAPAESFLLLELAPLKPSGVYPPRDDSDSDDTVARRLRHFEEVLELSAGDYVERGVWDDGHLGHDENGYEIPLPDTARLVVRWMSGKVLFVCKGSLWNGTPATYDGRHNRMTVQEIRELIERSLAARA